MASQATTAGAQPWRHDPAWLAAQDDPAAGPGAGPIFHYQSPHDPWLTSTYYFETDRGVVVIDSQLFASSVRGLWEEIQRRTSGRICAIVVTHAHADHVFGIPFLRSVAPQALVVSSAAVAEEIAQTAPALARALHAFVGDEVAATVDAAMLAPDVRFDERLELDLGDRALELHAVGRSEATAHVYGWLPAERAVFTGDLVQNRQHLWLEHDALGAWLEQVDALVRLAPQLVCSGHRGAAGPELLEETMRWLATCAGLLAEVRGDAGDPRAVLWVAGELRRRFPDWFDPLMDAQGRTGLVQGLEARAAGAGR